MKKLLFVFPSISAGGAERNAILISNYLTGKYNYEISFIILDDSDFYLELISKKISLIRLNKSYKNLNKINQLFYTYFLFGFLIYKHSKNKNYDKIIAIHEIEPEFALLTLHFLFKLNFSKNIPGFISIIQTILQQRYNLNNSLRKFRYFLLDIFRNKIIKNIIAVSHAIKEELERKKCKNIQVITNAVDVEFVKRKSCEKPLNFDGEIFQNPYFINIGRISIQKNQLMILNAFNKIKREMNYNLIILGDFFDKNVYNDLTDFISKNDLTKRVFLLGTINNPFYYIKNAKAFILSSIYEGFPLSILEAMSLETLVVSKKYSGHNEFLNNDNSILFSNQEELTKIMLEVSSSKNGYKNIINSASESIRNYDIKNTGEIYHKYFTVEK